MKKTKFCTKCHGEKFVVEFWNDKKTSDGLNHWCISCCKEDKKRYNLEHKSQISANKKEYYLLNKDKISVYKKSFIKKNKQKIKKYQIKYRQQNKFDLAKKKHEKYLKNKDIICQKIKEYRLKNLDKVREQERIKNKRRAKNPYYRLTINLRRRIIHALQDNYKSARTMELVGCSVEFLKKHLESQFTDGMSWENYGKGGWVVDHIRPCASFDLSKPLEQRKCFHYTNLQPLWEVENLEKSDKII